MWQSNKAQAWIIVVGCLRSSFTDDWLNIKLYAARFVIFYTHTGYKIMFCLSLNFIYLYWQFNVCAMQFIPGYMYIWGRKVFESCWLLSLYSQRFLVIQLRTIFQVTAECFCKENVYGQACDLCKDGTFNIQEKNDEGCSKCFCFSRTTRCSSSALYKDKVKLYFIYK